MKLNSSVVMLLLAATMILSSPDLPAHDAEGTLEKIARTGEFLIGYHTDSSPMSYENSEGVPSGYSVDLCRRIAVGVKTHLGKENMKTRFVLVASDERISAVVAGKVDILCGSTTITMLRQEQVDFTIPVFVTGGSVLSMAESGIHGLSDLSGKKVGVVRGTTTVEQLKGHLQQDLIDAKVVIVGDRGQGMDDLNNGRIDAFASDQIVLIGQIIESGSPKRFSLSGETFSYEPYGLVIRRNDADFRLVANKAITQIYRNGQHIQIFNKWIGRIGISPPAMLLAMYELNTYPE
jgi:ABC-type amino acid transport substrate-binding protein